MSSHRLSRLVAFLAVLFLAVSCQSGGPSPSGSTSPSASAPPPAPSAAGSSVATSASPTPSDGPIPYGAAEYFWGTESCTVAMAVPTPDLEGEVRERGGTIYCTLRTNDPRVNGTASGSIDFNGWGGAMEEWGSLRLENEGGVWTGTWSGVYTRETGDLISVWYQGSGGYAGLSFFEWIEAPPGTVMTGYDVVGLIFPGSPPSRFPPPPSR